MTSEQALEIGTARSLRERIIRSVAKIVLALLRWQVEGGVPKNPKVVAILAPHSSNWDFVVAFSVNLALGLGVCWLGKASLFGSPMGPIFRRWGGVPVDRTQSSNSVGRLAREFESRDRLWLTIAPEGTRKPVDRWKSGFYHIAREAGVPVVPVFLDWGRRRLSFGAPIPVSETEPDAVAADIMRIRSLYRGVRGKYHSV